MSPVEVFERNNFRKLNNVLPVTVNQLVEETGRVILNEAQSILSHLDWDTQSLAGSGSLQVERDGVSVRFGAGHASWVEFGRDPGVRPAIDNVVRFLMEKRGITSERFARRIAAKFCERVWRRGLPASPFLRPARAAGVAYAESAGATIARDSLEAGVEL